MRVFTESLHSSPGSDRAVAHPRVWQSPVLSFHCLDSAAGPEPREMPPSEPRPLANQVRSPSQPVARQGCGVSIPESEAVLQPELHDFSQVLTQR